MTTMGIGPVGIAKRLRIKRQFRWELTIPDTISGDAGKAIAVSTQRPTITFDEGRVNHVCEMVYYPTRAQYDPFTVTILDVETSNPIYVWLSKQFDAATSTFFYFDSTNKKNATLVLLDGMGEPLETWMINGLWPQQIQFGELDYSSNEVATISATFRFDRAYVV